MKLSLYVAMCTAVASAVPWLVRAADNATMWTYEATDETRSLGPAHWGDAFPTCAGKRQSPVDIMTDTVSTICGELPLHLSGTCDEYNVTQQYDAFKAEVLGGTCAVDYFGKVFRFAQVHFHAASEHTINGAAYDAEAHFVHKAADDSIVVLGVLLQRVEDEDDAETPPYFAKFVESLDGVDEQTPASVTLGSFHADVAELFAAGRVFNYAGGLTVPPCSEVVNWWVLETPLALSQDEYAAISDSLTRLAAVAPGGSNARPTQPLNGREIQAWH